jgi:hypothetical protein
MMRFFLMTSALVFACAGAVAAADIHPGPPVDIPKFTLHIPGFGTWSGQITAENAPTGKVACPLTITYKARVELLDEAPPGKHASPNPGAQKFPVSYTWSPPNSLAGAYEVSNAQPGVLAIFMNIALSHEVTIKYLTSTPLEGLPVSFFATLTGGFTSAAPHPTEQLRVVSHVVCLNARAR